MIERIATWSVGQLMMVSIAYVVLTIVVLPLLAMILATLIWEGWAVLLPKGAVVSIGVVVLGPPILPATVWWWNRSA
jgi:hypothetical protein